MAMKEPRNKRIRVRRKFGFFVPKDLRRGRGDSSFPTRVEISDIAVEIARKGRHVF